MEKFVEECNTWMNDCGMAVFGTKKMTASIVLERNSLSFAHLIFHDKQTVKAVFPINHSVSSSFVDNYNAVFVIQNKGTISFNLTFKDVTTTHMFHTQVAFCSRISQHSNVQFSHENNIFCEQYGKILQDIQFPPHLYPLSPLVTNEDVQKNWISRSKFVNYSYSTYIDYVNICFLTWNVQQKPPDDQTHRFIEFIFDKNIDIIVIALQEIDFSARAIVTGSSKLQDSWAQVFKRASESVGYESITDSNLGGVFLNILYKKDQKFQINVNVSGSQRFGTAGLTCNKSSIYAVISINQIRLGIGAAHLSAHNNEIEQRNSQIVSMIESIENQNVQYMVIMGDLNYRVDLPYEETVEKIKEGDLENILQKEQLSNVLKSHPIISMLKEPNITFNPTFKFDEYCNVYDTSPDRRIPSWTDRILARTMEPEITVGPTNDLIFETDIFEEVCEGVLSPHSPFPEAKLNYPFGFECTSYRSFDVQFSDHRPVSAEYTFPIPVVDEKRKEFVQETINSKLCHLIKLGTSEIVPSTTSICINDDQNEKAVTLKNTSRNISAWKIVSCPKYITVFPLSGILMPDETADMIIKIPKKIVKTELISINVENGPPIVFVLNPKS